MIEPKSKTQLKREADQLHALGRILTEFNKEELVRFNLPDTLNDAIIEMQSIRQRGAQKRHLQYIGKLMRHIDPEPIKKLIDTMQKREAGDKAQLHKLERWRDRLINEGNEALSELLETYPDSDRQYIRQLTRNAIKEQQQEKPPAAARKLFKYLRDEVL
ncbi:MAG: DUF615 domain-containing protein [Gammaproteobacteria bacterium]|nr:DUF615 domain-containing protein [Gammaproteobacteria bacterium]